MFEFEDKHPEDANTQLLLDGLSDEIARGMPDGGLALKREQTLVDLDNLRGLFRAGKVSPQEYSKSVQRLEYRIAMLEDAIRARNSGERGERQGPIKKMTSFVLRRK